MVTPHGEAFYGLALPPEEAPDFSITVALYRSATGNRHTGGIATAEPYLPTPKVGAGAILRRGDKVRFSSVAKDPDASWKRAVVNGPGVHAAPTPHSWRWRKLIKLTRSASRRRTSRARSNEGVPLCLVSCSKGRLLRDCTAGGWLLGARWGCSKRTRARGCVRPAARPVGPPCACALRRVQAL